MSDVLLLIGVVCVLVTGVAFAILGTPALPAFLVSLVALALNYYAWEKQR